MEVTSARVVEEIAKFTKRDIESIKGDTLLKNLVIESFVLVEMVIELQEVFDVRLNQEDLAGVGTVDELVTALQKKGS